LILKLKRQSRLLTYVNSYSETFSAGCTSVKGKIWVIYRKFSGKLLHYFNTVKHRRKTLRFKQLDEMSNETLPLCQVKEYPSTNTVLLLSVVSDRV